MLMYFDLRLSVVLFESLSIVRSYSSTLESYRLWNSSRNAIKLVF